MQRYQATQQDSFFGDFVLERAVPCDHFLGLAVNLKRLVKLVRGVAFRYRPSHGSSLDSLPPDAWSALMLSPAPACRTGRCR